jgi:hypothetical protein
LIFISNDIDEIFEKPEKGFPQIKFLGTHPLAPSLERKGEYKGVNPENISSLQVPEDDIE